MSAAVKQVEVKERPIIFSSAMVRTILEGRKTQTRRVVKGLPPGIKFVSELPESDYQYRFTDFQTHVDLRCPYGRPQLPLEPPRDHLWVREALTWSNNALAYKADDSPVPTKAIPPEFYNRTIRNFIVSQFMPRWASRITLGVKGIRAERLQDITEADAIAEGMRRHDASGVFSTGADLSCYATAREAFAHAWDTINKKRGFSFESNPFVWVIEFKKL